MIKLKDILKEANIISISPEDMDKLHGDGTVDVDGVTLTYKEPTNPTPVDEGIKYDTGMQRVGNNPTEKRTSKHFGKTNSINDLAKLLKGLPRNIKKIKVPVQLGDFNPKTEIFSPSQGNKILKIVNGITKAAKEQGNPVKGYSLNSYFSVFHDEEPRTTDAYIGIEYRSSKAFADMMSRDEFLD